MVSFRTAPTTVLFRTAPNIVSFRTAPNIVSFRTAPNTVSFRTAPNIVSFRTAPNTVSFRTAPKYCFVPYRAKILFRSVPRQILFRSVPSRAFYRPVPFRCVPHLREGLGVEKSLEQVLLRAHVPLRFLEFLHAASRKTQQKNIVFLLRLRVRWTSRLLISRGTMLNRTYGTRKNLYIPDFYWQYLVLFTMVPRKYCSY